MVVQILLVPLLDHGVPAVLPDVLVVGVHGGAGLVHEVGHNLVKQLLVKGGVVVSHLFLADFGHHLVNQGHLLLDFLVGLDDGVVHDGVGQLLGARLDHDDLARRGGHGQVQLGGVLLLVGGVIHQSAVHIAHLQAADGARPGDAGHGQTGGHADHGGHLGGTVAVHAHDSAGANHVVAEIVGEQGADGAVDDPPGQHGGQGGLALAAHEGAGDAAHGVQLLLKVHGQGEEVDAVPGAGGDGGGNQHGGLAVGDQGGGGGQLGHLAHVDGQGAAAQVHGPGALVGKLLVGDDG